MSIPSLSSLQRLTELSDTWEALGGASGVLCFREVTDRSSPFALKPSFIKRLLLWCTRPFRKSQEILGQKVILFDQTSNLEAVHALAFDALFSYFSLPRTTPEMDAAIQKVIDFSLSLDQQFGGRSLASIFRKTIRALPPGVGISPEICTVATKILQKEENQRLNIVRTLLRTLCMNAQLCPMRELDHILKGGIEALGKLGIETFLFDRPTCEILLRKIKENGPISASLISRLWVHFPQDQLLELAMKAIDQSTSGAELEATVHELKNLEMIEDDCAKFCESVIHRAALLQPLELRILLSLYQDISSLLNEDQRIHFGKKVGQEVSNVLSSKTPEQALQELPKILKDAEHVPVDLIPLRRCMAGKWKEIVGKIAGDLHISGIKDLSSVQTVLQNSFKVHPDFKGVPYPHLQEQLEADWQSGMCDIYPAIQKKLEEAASKDIPSLQSEKALQDALKALRTLEETLSEDPFPIKSDADKAKRTSCLEYVKALIQDLLRPIEKEASPKPSEKAGRPEMVAATEPLAEAQPVEQIETIPTAISHKHLRGVVISTVASTLGLLSGAALTTRLAGGGYQEFQSGIEIQVFLGIAAATYGTLAANALSRVPRKWKKAAQAALTMGQAALFAAPSVIASASGGELVSRIFDKAVSAVAAGLAAKALNKPVQETIKERMGEGPLSAVVVEVASAACFQAASQAVAFAHLPLESVQSAAGGVKPQRAVSATKTKAAPALSASVGVETEPSSVMAEPVKVEEPSVLKAPPYTSQKSETLSVSAANPLPEVGFFEALWIAGKALVEGGGEGTPVFLPQNQDLARIAGDIPVTQVYSPTPQYVYSTPPTGVGGGVPI